MKSQINNKRGDQVFQLTLTEIAFTLVFILMLLMGWMIYNSEKEREALEVEIAEAGDIKAQQIAIYEAKTALTQALSGIGQANPEEIISNLVSQKRIAGSNSKCNFD